jgi:hypothetical protein
MFFKAVAAEVSDEVEHKAVAAISEHFQERHRSLADLDQQEANLKPSNRDAPGRRAEIDRQRELLRPHWLLWKHRQDTDGERPVEELAERARPKVLGRYTNGLPFIVRRYWDRGQVLFVSTSLSPGWNTLPVQRQAVWIYDRVCRSMLLDTFPSRNLSTEQPLVLPIAPAERSARFTLVDSTGEAGSHEHEQPLSVDAQGGDRYGITLSNWMHRGTYRVTAARAQDAKQDSADAKLWEMPIAVNGPAEESDLGSVDSTARSKPGRLTFAEAAQTGAAMLVDVQGTDFSKWTLAVVLGILLTELAILAWFTRSSERTT